MRDHTVWQRAGRSDVWNDLSFPIAVRLKSLRKKREFKEIDGKGQV